MNRSLSYLFPHDDYRFGQKYLVDRLHKCINNDNIEIVIVEAPTGFGKTAAAGTVAAKNSPSYYLTEQKIHQDQMVEEFPRYAKVCKGRDNYQCGANCDNCPDHIPDSSISCHKKPTSNNNGNWAGESSSRGDLYWKSGIHDKCPYFKSKTDGFRSEIACLNYSYFFNETYYSGDFGKRNVIIADEAHNVGNNMSSFLTFRVDNFVTEETDIDIKDRGDRVADWEEWILGNLKNSVEVRLKELNEKIVTSWQNDEDIEYEVFEKQDTFDEILCNINRFNAEYDSDYFGEMDWAVERSYNENDEIDNVSFTPVSIAPFADRFLFNYADTLVLMSASILNKDTLARSLGLKRLEDKTYTMSFPSPFDADIRPIIYYDAPSVNHDNHSEVFPKVAELIDSICQKPEHLNEKGIIHSVSYKNEEVIKQNVSRPTRRRLMSHEDGERNEVLEEFKNSDRPRILLSPSMIEGVDLKYDLSRFQIIPKVPYLSLGSKAVQLKKERDPEWYDWRTAIKTVQSFGRSVRAEDDFAKTYVVDGSFERFLKQNEYLFPDYITGNEDEDINPALKKGDVLELLERTKAVN